MKTILCVIAICLSLTVNGQSKKTIEISGTFNSIDPILPLGNLFFGDSRNSDAGKEVNKSIAPGLTAKYFFAENTALRLRFIYTKRDLTYQNAGFQGAGSFEEVTNQQNIYKIAPGWQWSFVQKNFSFFSGLDIPLTLIGTMTEVTNIATETSSGRSTVYRTHEIPGGTAFGLGFFMGANFSITKLLGIGFEMGTACEQTHVGGTIVMHQTGSTSGEFVTKSDQTFKRLGFASIQAGVTLSFHFRK
jgi:outer membrane protein W